MRHLAIIFAMLIWGSVGLFARWAHQPAEIIVFYRVLTAVVLLAPGTAWRRQPRALPWQAWAWGAASGLSLALNWIFFFRAVAHTSIANATLSYYTSPIWVTLIGATLFGERVTLHQWLALALGVSGVTMTLPLLSGATESWLGIGEGLLAALFYAGLTLLGKRAQQLDAQVLVALQTTVATALLLPLAIRSPLPPANSLVIMASIGAIHTALALFLYMWGLKAVPATVAGILSYLDPLTAIALAWLVLGEPLNLPTIAGGTLILLASLILMWGERSRQKRSSGSHP